MSEGWFSLHRKITDSVVWTNSDMLKLWILCLKKASHKERPKNVFDGNIVPLGVGDFITGRDSLAAEFNKGAKKSDVISAVTLYRWLRKFETMQMLNIKSTTKYSVVTVINFISYQSIEQPVNNNCTTSEQRVNTNNNVNNLYSPPPTDISNIYINTHEEFSQNFGRPMSPIEMETIDGWLTKDKYDPEVIRVALKEAVMNGAYSLKYIDRILLSWERKRITSKSAALANVQKRNERSVSKESAQDVPAEELPTVPLYNWMNPEGGVQS